MNEKETRKYSTDFNESDDSEDFASLFEATQRTSRNSSASDNKVVADIVSIGDEWIFVDIGGKTEGMISRAEFQDETGELTVKKGESIAAYIIRKTDGEVILSRRMTMAASAEAAREAFQRHIPVEGLVMEERKGGFSVKLFGKLAFCPYSQIDLVSGTPASEYIGQKLSFKITEYSERGRNIVLSRRKLLEEERQARIEELKNILKVDDVVSGSVKRIEPFGAFVDIGGVEGLVPISEVAWGRIENVSDVLSTGQPVTVKIISLDWGRNRISLSLKQATEDPWSSVAEKYPAGSTVRGQITRVTNFGAFLELEPGVDGLIHISNLGQGKRISHPRDVVSTGMTLEVKVISVDPDNRRIGLEVEKQANLEHEDQAVVILPGQIVTGVVESVQEYGVFVKLENGKTGLLHLSEIDAQKSGDLKRKFVIGANVDVKVLSVDEQSGKISLSQKAIGAAAEKQQIDEFRTKLGQSSSFGTLGDLLKEKLGKN